MKLPGMVRHTGTGDFWVGRAFDTGVKAISGFLAHPRNNSGRAVVFCPSELSH